VWRQEGGLNGATEDAMVRTVRGTLAVAGPSHEYEDRNICQLQERKEKKILRKG
jgi:hypothetical protein